MENDGDKIDWKDRYADKYIIRYDYVFKRYDVVSHQILRFFSTPYFYSKEIAQRAIDEIIIPFTKGELPCCKIWEE